MDIEQPIELKISNEHGEDASKIIDNSLIGTEPQKSMPSLNLSSTLEPIFKTDEDEDTNQIFATSSVNNDIELEISMEEFIKFKDSNNQNLKNEPSTFSNDFPQMPSAIKMEITDEEDSENEANFRNFFSQYRASLNLLYERH